LLTPVCVGGIAADRLGRRTTLVVAQLANALTTLLLLLSRDSTALGAVAFLLGFFAGASRPAASAMMIDLVRADDRRRVFSLNYWAMNVGFAVSSALAGFMMAWDYRVLFVVDAVTTGACAVLVLIRVPETSPTRIAATPCGQGRHLSGPGLGGLLRDRTFLVLMVIFLSEAAILQQMTVTLPIAMRASGLSTSTYGLVIALNGLLVVILQIPIGVVSAKRPLFSVLTIGAGLIGIGFGLTAFASTVAFYVFTLFLWTMGEILNAPAGPAVAAELAPSDSHGRYQGAWSSAWGIGAVLAPVVGGGIYARFGGSALWMACAVVGLGVAATYHALGRRLTGRSANPEGRLRALQGAGVHQGS